MAGDPLATILLIGLGLKSLSLNPGLIPEVKEIVRATTCQQAREVAKQCLLMQSGDEVRGYLEEVMGEILPFWRRASRRD